MENILITGANRGLGLEFTRQYLEQGAHVFAGCRQPAAAISLHTLQARYPRRLSIVPLDVADANAIRRAHDMVHSQTESIDILINNAGIYSSHGGDEPLERLGRLSFEDALTVLRVNAVAPLLVGAAVFGALAGRPRRQAHQYFLGIWLGLSQYRWLSVLLQRQQGRAEHVHAYAGGRCQALGHHHGAARPWLGEHRHGRSWRTTRAREGGGCDAAPY